MFCRTHIQIQVENQAKHKGKMCNERNGEAHLHATIWAEHHQGKGPGPPRNRPCKGSHEAGPPGCEHTLGVAAPPPPLIGPMLLPQLHASMHMRFWLVLMITNINYKPST
jgi:hypothetical protein